MKGMIRFLAVRIAEMAGWLTIVDREIVTDYVDPKSAAIRMLNELFRNYQGFYSASPTPITCVEVAFKDGYVAVRNSRDPKRITVFFTNDEWNAFVNGVKAGKFDIIHTVATIE